MSATGPRPDTTPSATLVSFSVHLTDYLPLDRQRFELRFGEHVVWTDTVWTGRDDPMDEAIWSVARRLGALMNDGALIQYEEDS